jgi:hypothetical protein
MKSLLQYNKVLPRDLFNESKALKNIGHLYLLCHDGLAHGIKCFDSLDGGNDPFELYLTHDGYLYCSNVFFRYNGYPLFLKSLYNSKNNYTLFLESNYEDFLVFDEIGNLTEEFLEEILKLKN